MSTILDESKALLQRIVLIACGSFSPPTPMHLRMFEIARDHFEEQATHTVIGGIMSPTHDAYGKKGLVPATHRIAMLKLALNTSNWIRVSRWETEQQQWTRTRDVLAYHQNFMNNLINSRASDAHDGKGDNDNWCPDNLLDIMQTVQLKLLCGADLLESFATPGLWADQDIEDIVANHGLVVISRSGSNPEKFIFDSDVLSKYKRNITLITNWVPNEVSSTMIRRLLSRGQSVKYLIDDAIIDYIKCYGLFNCNSKFISDLIHNAWPVIPEKHLRPVIINALQQQHNMNVTSATTQNNNNYDDDADAANSIEHVDNLSSPNKARAFCCSETRQTDKEDVKSRITRRPQLHAGPPGQAVQLIVSENGTKTIQDSQQISAKKMRVSHVQQV